MSRVDQLFQDKTWHRETDYATLRVGEYIFIKKHEICDDMHLVFAYIHVDVREVKNWVGRKKFIRLFPFSPTCQKKFSPCKTCIAKLLSVGKLFRIYNIYFLHSNL